jgi:hypothetical protein
MAHNWQVTDEPFIPMADKMVPTTGLEPVKNIGFVRKCK